MVNGCLDPFPCEVLPTQARVGERTGNQEPAYDEQRVTERTTAATANQNVSTSKTWNRVVPEVEERSSPNRRKNEKRRLRGRPKRSLLVILC
jgi:hypothetical protein